MGVLSDMHAWICHRGIIPEGMQRGYIYLVQIVAEANLISLTPSLHPPSLLQVAGCSQFLSDIHSGGTLWILLRPVHVHRTT